MPVPNEPELINAGATPKSSRNGSACHTACRSGCMGGAKILKEPIPLELAKPLAVTSDANLTAAVDWVIVPNGPGTWARKAGWDEYLISVQPLSDWLLKMLASISASFICVSWKIRRTGSRQQ